MQYKELSKASAAAKTIGNYSFYKMSEETPIDYTDCFTYTTTATAAKITGLTSKGQEQEILETPITYNGLPITEISGCNGNNTSPLKKLTINTPKISDYSFITFPNLLELKITNSVTSIGSYCFSGLGINELIIPDSVTTIGNDTYITCPQLTSIRLGASLSKVGARPFYNSPITNIIISSRNNYFIQKNNCLVEISTKKILLGGYQNSTIPTDGSVTSIAAYSFYGKINGDIYIPENIVIIDGYAFGYLQATQTIYCAAASKPTGWNNRWYTGNPQIVWGYNP